jgi:hypothetical protein
MWADLDSILKATTYEIKLESIPIGAQSIIEDEIAESLRISTHTILREGKSGAQDAILVFSGCQN